MKLLLGRMGVVFVVCVIIGIVIIKPSMAAANISIWWPTNNAEVSGTQPFKALVDNMPIDSYRMYWQVDGGQLNEMGNDPTDYPHKEASVDLSGWHWQESGNYSINFIAKDTSGNIIASAAENIIANKNTSINLPPPAVNQPPAPPARDVTHIWWPTNGAHLTRSQPFKAVVDGMNVSDYKMYWQVDGGQLNEMDDNDTDSPHKEYQVDLTNWNWNGVGPYVVRFVAMNSNGGEIGNTSATIYVDSNTSTPAPVVTTDHIKPTIAIDLTPAPPSSTPPPVPPISTTSLIAGDPLSGMTFYVNPNSNASKQAEMWSSSRPLDAAQMEKIASQPEARWLGGWNTDVQTDTRNYVDQAALNGQVPVLIAYNIPNRDCNGYSSGGASDASSYKAWIRNLADGIGRRSSVVILEPDALAMMDCLSSNDQAVRYSLLNDAIFVLKANKQTVVYIDAGNSNWISAQSMSERLKSAGLSKADGFAVNVSNYYWTSDLIHFGKEVSAATGGAHFVVDTSRNGAGPDGSNWCNPNGRALGQKVTTATGDSLIDAYLWLKNPGESDGTCNGGPSAGVWWPEYALGLAERANY